MNSSSARSERITAIISTVVAVIILAGGVTAYQTNTAPVEDIVQLESDLRFQLEVAFKHDPNERAKRLVELSKVSRAWLDSPRSDADREQLARWLLESTIRSMPGSIDDLPKIPTFGAKPQPAKAATPDVIVEPPAAEQPSRQAPEPVAQTPTPAALVSAEIPQTSVDEVLDDDAVERVEFSIRATSEGDAAAKTQASAPPAEQVPAPVNINLTELAARIAGYHAGLDEIEKRLLTLRSDDFAALAEQVLLLKELTRDYQFVDLYYAALSENERRAVTAPRAMSTTLAEIERRLDRAEANASDDFLGEFDANNQQRIGELRELLTEVSAQVSR